jgi:hypothetical protein
MLEISGILDVFVLGLVGGAAAEAVRWYKIRDSPNRPIYWKSPFYWTITVIMILIGGGLACLYGTENVNSILAVNIGASAPLIISALTSTVPPSTVPPGAGGGGSGGPHVAGLPTKALARNAEPKKKRRRELVLDFISWR